MIEVVAMPAVGLRARLLLMAMAASKEASPIMPSERVYARGLGEGVVCA